MKNVRMVGPRGPSSQTASAKNRSIATLWVPKILRPLTSHPPSTGRAIVRGRNATIALSGSEPEPPQISCSAAIRRSFCSTFGALNLR